MPGMDGIQAVSGAGTTPRAAGVPPTGDARKPPAGDGAKPPGRRGVRPIPRASATSAGAPPAHAGRLPVWERVIVGLVVSVMLMATAVLYLSARAGLFGWGGPAGVPRVTAIRHGGSWLPGAAGSPGRQPGDQRGGAGGSGTPGRPDARAVRPAPSARLAAALGPLLHGKEERLGAGVIVPSSRTIATYHGRQRFPLAGLIRLDILAAALMEHQLSRQPLTGAERYLAARMMTADDQAATAALWDQIGQEGGLAAVNRVLGLGSTDVGGAGYLTQARTSPGDQLRLLSDMTSPLSPLNDPWRDYGLRLLRLRPGSVPGAAAAASRGTVPAVCNGWARNPVTGLWSVSSVGVIRQHGRRLLIVVMADGLPTLAGGARLVEAAARAAAGAAS
jgi:hypothetical protein